MEITSLFQDSGIRQTEIAAYVETRNCLVVKSVLMFTLNVCISVLCELIAADIRAKWSPLGSGIRGSRYKMARLLMTGEIGLCRHQSIKV